MFLAQLVQKGGYLYLTAEHLLAAVANAANDVPIQDQFGNGHDKPHPIQPLLTPKQAPFPIFWQSIQQETGLVCQQHHQIEHRDAH